MGVAAGASGRGSGQLEGVRLSAWVAQLRGCGRFRESMRLRWVAAVVAGHK